jgi:hypothetical protein
MKGMILVAKQNPESEDDFIRMQQEAIKRVRDMQSRARATLENAGMHIENSNTDFPLERTQNGNIQSDLFSQYYSAHQSSDATRSNTTHSDTAHSDTAHSDTAHSDTTRSNVGRSNVPHPDSARSDAARTYAPHESGRPVEKNEPQQGEPPLIHALGLNLSLDNDQLLLMLTIYMLIKDGADKWLILSLAYVMLT